MLNSIKNISFHENQEKTMTRFVSIASVSRIKQRKYISSKQLLLRLPREVDCNDEQMEDILSVVIKRSISIMLKKIEIPIFKIL